MEVKLMIILFVTLALFINDQVVADFFFNHPLPKAANIHNSSRYKCVPGRTIIKITEKQPQSVLDVDSDSDEYRLRSAPTRKKHMTVPTSDEYCRVCVCSAEGRNEYCSNRPADNVNECLMLKDITDKYNMGLPYEHTRSLSNRIRRDYLWHNDEIPYEAKAKCFRGHSYYSNSITANNTDIDIGTDIESLLDYSNEFTCYYCVCSVDGKSVGCIHRDVTFCNFFRVIRNDKHVRDRYTSLLQQDRPSYFRTLSFRMRRTMDNGIFDLINTVGGEPTNKKCVPFVSEYSNCNDDNLCSGCTRCSCTAEGQWTCADVMECDINESDDKQLEDDDEIFDNALKMLEFEMQKQSLHGMKTTNHPNVPGPQTNLDGNALLGTAKQLRLDEIMESFMRSKRSTAKKSSKHSKRSIEKANSKHAKTTNSSNNNTIKFYGAGDDLNEDTLKNINVTGTLTAKKIDIVPHLIISRRSGDTDNSSKALQIEYNQPKAYNQITDNKIEVMEQENKFDASHENLKTALGNYTQKVKDTDLSKVVVNELRQGKEIIGDISAPVTSNITFTPENDTLTAMAFIAGNLLNKLWNMEKDASGSSIETDVMKHEKITDLLDLFKEPLNLRQETFLKNALEQLSSALDKDKDGKNISVCENIEEAKKLLYDTNGESEEAKHKVITKEPCKTNKVKLEKGKQNMATVKAIAKINNVLDLIKKFENIQGSLTELKHGPKLDFNLNHTTPTSRKLDTIDTILTKEENNSLNLFGNLLEKITKLILPKKNNKKIVNQIRSQNLFGENDNLKNKFKKMYNIDLTNMTVTAKDKLILDYLTHVDRNPNCLLNNNNHKRAQAIQGIEGNILLNLSEFFKMKSFSDLIKLLEPEKHNSLRAPTENTNQVVETTTAYEENKLSSNFTNVDSKKFSSTKEKLKAHLKTIIEDLVELQNANGVSIKGNIKIADALPCLYNLLNAGREEIDTKKEENINPAEKIAKIFNGLKKEIKAVKSRRNNGDILEERPKSAIVWERLVKNLNEQSNIKSRRSLQTKVPKSYNKIKESMEKIENGSSTYKHFALLVQIPPAGRLMLLKALDQDVEETIRVIEDMQLSFEDLSKLPAEDYAELVEFVGNMARSINLSVKVNEKIKPELRQYFVNEINSGNRILKPKTKKKPVLGYEMRNEENDDMRVSRLQIVTQLIRNRMQTFIKMKEESEYDVHNDMNYEIAQRVLYYLDTGNYDLAKELFKVFVTRKQNLGKFSNKDPANEKFDGTSTPKLNEMPMRRMASHQMEPLVQFEDPNKIKDKHVNWANQDHLIKQLLNMKNMGL